MQKKEMEEEVEDSDDESGKEEQLSLKSGNLRVCQGLLRKFLTFALELVNFLKNFEYFLFESIIANQSRIFESLLREKTSLNQIIQLHMNYLTIIADKMFLNQKVD